MKRLVLSAALVLAPACLIAQSSAVPAEIGARHAHPGTPHKAAVRLGRKLNLSADQQARLEPILAERKQKMDAVRANTQLSDMERRRQTKAVRQQSRAQMSAVLTPEQMQQVKAMHRARRAAPASRTGI